MKHFDLYLLLITAWIIPGCSGNARSFFSAELQQSPFGIGVRSAFSRTPRHSTRHVHKIEKSSRETRPCSQEDSEEDFARCAAVLRDEAVALGMVVLPHLKVKKHPQLDVKDELDWLEGELATPCVKLSVQRAAPHSSLPDMSVNDPKEGVVQISSTSDTRGGGVYPTRPLVFWENMICGAVSRSVAQTVMHPANTMKTILQSSRGAERPTLKTLMRPDQFRMLTRGAGANFLLSVPHGAVNFAVLEFVRGKMNRAAQTVPFLRERLETIGPALDFASSAVSTICCSVVSTPQMMITDNIMAGNYPNLPSAISGLYSNGGLVGFYRGWMPGLVGKIPSYALTWTFFQQLKRIRNMMSDRPATNLENTIMGCMGSTVAVCIMIPMDTIKTRLVTQMSSKVVVGVAYKGIIDCAIRVAKEEGMGAFYRGLPPRLISVVPMIGIQFGVYEAMKQVMLHRNLSPEAERKTENLVDRYRPEQALQEAAMEVAASPDQPMPAPQFLERIKMKSNGTTRFGLKVK
mmetsp:Transcript_52760/g.148042  ORF Transcript_52760/g.148042 Transcript_52760/m.148042 type:complete len:518 (+) Transcript_52760:321-1874(+)